MPPIYEDHALPWPIADGYSNRRKPALAFRPSCVSIFPMHHGYCKMWLEPPRHMTFLSLFDTRVSRRSRFYLCTVYVQPG